MFWRRVLTNLQVTLVLAGIILLFAREWPAFGDPDDQINAIVGQDRFDFLVWETQAFLTKAESILFNGHTFLTEAENKQIVLEYLELLHQAQELDAQITQIYIDPEITEPDAASVELQAELEQTRAHLDQLQPLAEAIVQDQVETVLVAEGFSVGGQAWPPVMMHMSPLPSLLVASPRDRIERSHTRSLVPGLTTPDKELLEKGVRADLDLSALVVPIGGMGTYPAMIQETSSISRLAEVTAHEWSHHWLNFYPVGLNYNDPEVRTINETIASIVDVEIMEKVIARYYPEFVPPPPEKPPAAAPAAPEPLPEPPGFDFRAEMAATRIQVDELLADGKIDEAEGYMEERRQLFVENGYPIRKLNQAYFAFYGAYASQPGATGSDPTGPMLRDIREGSPSIKAFLQTTSTIDSFSALEQIWQEMNGGS